jgi:hypothetical protein
VQEHEKDKVLVQRVDGFPQSSFRLIHGEQEFYLEKEKEEIKGTHTSF